MAVKAGKSEAAYPQKVLNIIKKTLYEDVAVIGNVKPVNIAAIKKILWLMQEPPLLRPI